MTSQSLAARHDIVRATSPTPAYRTLQAEYVPYGNGHGAIYDEHNTEAWIESDAIREVPR